MHDFTRESEWDMLNRISKLVEEALELCDKVGYAYVAIDLCAAGEKLKVLKAKAENESASAACRGNTQQDG